ncbi:hypothetical protein RclHR1_01190015 [Rhizophagus clarus]|uniref:F-box domain-containing protein n=1 Tax=Rhizophagus clarus TaxID=94130 RepID=A0A2Z6QHU6_9GLOM|nr:hypothetical protein RclHR1_01190015 [Rhizophagus clarus]GET02119.1 hypothetical protein GLOIN_2v1810887 [Rhizophagus clarus]
MEKLNADCLILVFKELQEDNESLYSCLLVNREWCRLAVPILWEKCQNFSIFDESREKFYNTILSCLPTSSKQLLLENNIKLPQIILSRPPTFNYISFCKFISGKIISDIRDMVFKKEIGDYSKERNLLEQEIYKLFINQCKNIKELEWIAYKHLSSFPGALTCFSQLYSLDLNLYLVNSDDLFEMARICKDLSKLSVCNCTRDIPGLISLIDAQRNLKSVSFNFCINIISIDKMTCKELSKILAKKGCTINNITLQDSVCIIPLSFLTSLVNLKDLTIRHSYCEDYQDDNQGQLKYLATSTFPDLESFIFEDYLICCKELAMLIEKTKGNLWYVEINIFDTFTDNTGMLLKAIANNCPKLKYLTTYIGSKDLIYVKSLLINCKFLKSLQLNDSVIEKDNVGDKLLDMLSKYSPKYLNIIKISGYWNYSVTALEKFFESFRERKLICFDIKNGFSETITIEQIKVIRKYFDKGVIGYSNVLGKNGLLFS